VSEKPFPYNLPLWRERHKASSPDGKHTAEIDPTFEISMGNPTYGTLRTDFGFELEKCNPNFLWSDDSRHLAVPQFFTRLGFQTRQRVVVVDLGERKAYSSKSFAYYYQLVRFQAGVLRAVEDPHRRGPEKLWEIPEDLGRFERLRTLWRRSR
jgi:hypothetical protein